MNERPVPQQTPALHIGWWRNGYHEYEPPGIDEQRIRRHGGLLAAAIGSVWLIGATALCLATGGSLILVLGLFVPPLPIVYFLGERLAVKTVTGNNTEAALRLAFVTVVVNSFAVAFGFVLYRLFAPRDPGAVMPPIFQLLLLGILYGLLGIIFVGWLAIVPALISAWVWQRVLRRIVGSSVTQLDD